jgi:hypothetical protein
MAASRASRSRQTKLGSILAREQRAAQRFPVGLDDRWIWADLQAGSFELSRTIPRRLHEPRTQRLEVAVLSPANAALMLLKSVLRIVFREIGAGRETRARDLGFLPVGLPVLSASPSPEGDFLHVELRSAAYRVPSDVRYAIRLESELST